MAFSPASFLRQRQDSRTLEGAWTNSHASNLVAPFERNVLGLQPGHERHCIFVFDIAVHQVERLQDPSATRASLNSRRGRRSLSSTAPSTKPTRV